MGPAKPVRVRKRQHVPGDEATRTPEGRSDCRRRFMRGVRQARAADGRSSEFNGLGTGRGDAGVRPGQQ
jgi:hypothetical protein